MSMTAQSGESVSSGAAFAGLRLVVGCTEDALCYASVWVLRSMRVPNAIHPLPRRVIAMAEMNTPHSCRPCHSSPAPSYAFVPPAQSAPPVAVTCMPLSHAALTCCSNVDKPITILHRERRVHARKLHPLVIDPHLHMHPSFLSSSRPSFTPSHPLVSTLVQMSIIPTNIEYM